MYKLYNDDLTSQSVKGIPFCILIHCTRFKLHAAQPVNVSSARENSKMDNTLEETEVNYIV